jgi:hypothetical protein
MATDKSDYELAFEFLSGRVTTTDGKISHVYLCGEEEREAQAALVRLLRSHRDLGPMFRWRLAGLFDPGALDDRQLVFEARHRGEPGWSEWTHLEIARVVGERAASGLQLKAAKSKALELFGVPLRTVERAWRKHKTSPLVADLFKSKRH